MNLTAILIILFSISASAAGFSQNKINLQVKKSAIADAISKIEEQTSYRFLYNQNLGEINQKVSVKLEDVTIDEALIELFKDSGLRYQFINDDLIAIQKNEVKSDIVVSGKVTDSTGEALIGVTVKIKGTNTGVTTNSDGVFSITAPEKATLVFSYLGFQSIEQNVSGQTRLNVVLSPSTSQLNEVVVVGYGTQRKVSLTTSVASVGGENIAERGTVSPIQGVQGQVAGVDISAGSGRAGASYNIQIRGQNSLQGGSVLYVVDGVIVEDISFLNPQDISKMDILKDAASTAIYGSRGSNGVVIVTTKQGSNVRGGATISYDAYTGIRDVARMPDFMTGDEWVEYRNNTYIVPAIAGNQAYTASTAFFDNPVVMQRIADKDYTNWRDLLLKSGSQTNHSLAVSGTSSNDISYILGVGYQNEKGNLINENYTRYNFKASVDHKLSSRFRAGISLNLSLAETERGSDLAVTNAFRMAPIFKPYNAAGNLDFRPGQIINPNLPSSATASSFTSTVNPLLDNANSETENRKSFGLGNIYLQYSPLSWLSVKSSLSPRLTHERFGRYFGSQTEARGGLSAAAALQNEEVFGYIFDNVLNASKVYKEHSFDFTGLFSMQLNRNELAYARVADLPFNSSFYNLGTGVREVNTSGFEKSSLLSYMARLNYSFKDKYLVTLATRLDGSSKLSPGNKWASFPSAAIAWRVSEEPFLKDLSKISELKLRFSAGVAGNNNNINPYGTQMNLSAPTYYDFGGTSALGYSPNRLPNSNLTWETTREYDLGLDLGLFRGKVSATVDVYDKLSSDIILSREIALENGWNNITDNIGSVSNKGVELSLRTVNISKKDFSWTTSVNFARNKNAIEELINGKEDMVGNGWFIGQPIRSNFTYVFDGIWQESERAAALKYSQVPGQAKVKDLDGNFILNNADRRIVGQQAPKWTGGFSTQLTFKDFDFSTSLFARQGQQVTSPFHAEFLNLADRGRIKLNVDYYMGPNNITPTRASNKYPQPQNPGPYWSSVGYLKDASFVKVQNIILGYTIPAKLLQKARLKSARLYANVLNPLVWTKYDGFDPEYADGAEPRTTSTMNQINLPTGLNNTGVSTVTYQFGVNVKF